MRSVGPIQVILRSEMKPKGRLGPGCLAPSVMTAGWLRDLTRRHPHLRSDSLAGLSTVEAPDWVLDQPSQAG